ncbi:DEAD/DEAH box helicase [Motilimonas pumila]|uniref:Helicase SNF2 n=1 Tax=Motilimonas pumila TaxID=2303987 RepID=A0A418YA80_9GAMM|nr:DEAD/DEAH box helicase [Motilimonas pumila]RJG39208.1 helicase SNF2 [Motilimonas pumila]
MLEYSEKDIKNSFGGPTFDRGMQVFTDNQVQKCKYSPELDKLIGSVAGTFKDSYSTNVEVKASNQPGKLIIRSQCSCPVGWNCKHAVALLLAYKKQLEPADPYQLWFNQLPAHYQQPMNLASAAQKETAIFCLSPDKSGNIQVEVGSAKTQKDGSVGAFSNKRLEELVNDYSWSDSWLTDFDKNLVRLLLLKENDKYNIKSTLISTENDELALKRMLASGRSYWVTTANKLTLGEAKPLQIDWQQQEDKKRIQLGLNELGEQWQLLATPNPWYIDTERFIAGPITTSLDGHLVAALQQLPALGDEQATHFTNELLVNFSEAAIPAPIELPTTDIEQALVPTLEVNKGELENGQASLIAKFWFAYGNVKICPSIIHQPKQTRFVLEGQHYHIKRDNEAEQLAWHQYHKLNLQAVNEHLLQSRLDQQELQGFLYSSNKLSQEELWLGFKLMHEGQLKQQGWHIRIATDIDLSASQVDGLNIEIEEHNQWFDVGLSIEVEGREVPLLPMLVEWIQRHDDWKSQQGDLILPQSNGAMLTIKRSTIAPILAILEELTNQDSDKLRLPNTHAAVLAQLPDINQWVGGDHVKQLAQKLASFTGIKELPPSVNLSAELRHYQQEGLNWLNFLFEYGFGGILADDMGLGKTVQTLAYLQHRKDIGELNKPALVICPTSLVGNWQAEAQKFTPGLSTLKLHGPERKALFEKVNDHDIVISTYPLLVRDSEFLAAFEFSELVLDEAQVIKNPSAKMTQTVKKLNAQHKLCLTGTPMENHLGELWSIYDFLMPGFLGNLSGFNKHYRTPIEKEGDQHSKQWLKQKVSPFLLRRTKDQVATELPPKTEITHVIEMPPEQRTLYESIRVTMEAKVQGLLTSKGMARSRIEFLDALLKMRQACCDPKLVKLEEAQKIQSSAKLDFLMDIVPEMLEEGRRILIFSQFAQMLSIIEDRFKQAGIDYAKLTGQTQKRAEVIDSFQNGDVPVFLISLKAGGVGLNLTAADTVIHYDPWWNPAAENQATDRAYRIGQDKPVFVYKLICEKTVEERVLQLQKQKQQLADGMYGDKDNEQQMLTDSDQLLKLFESM